MIGSNMRATSHIKVIPARITSGKNENQNNEWEERKSETNNKINKLVFVNDRFSSMIMNRKHRQVHHSPGPRA